MAPRRPQQAAVGFEDMLEIRRSVGDGTGVLPTPTLLPPQPRSNLPSRGHIEEVLIGYLRRALAEKTDDVVDRIPLERELCQVLVKMGVLVLPSTHCIGPVITVPPDRSSAYCVVRCIPDIDNVKVEIDRNGDVIE